MNVIRYEKDSDNIVHLVLDRPEASANVMDANFQHSINAVADRVLADDNVAGVIYSSSKKTFLVGGDLDSIFACTDARQMFDMAEGLKAGMRKIETAGIPVVACVNGAALGGGFELVLSCHHRICLDKNIPLGLPEAGLGLLPGGGGITRMVRLLGIQAAMPFLIEGKQFRPAKALELGLIHELADSEEDMLIKAKAWIKANPQSAQPWDVKGYKIPGGTPADPQVAQMLPMAPASIRAKTKGVLPAPESILCAMIEGSQVDFDSASRIESRYFGELAVGQVAKNTINTFWYQLNEVKAGASRPDGYETQRVKKLGILGAGMMGAGIAYAAAMKGVEVVLKDVSMEGAENGKDYSVKLLDKAIARGRSTEEKKAQVLALITPTVDADDLKGCDLVIEAVFEDRDLKARVTEEAEARLDPSAVFASNTSTLPITGLAEASARPANFIGMHFFSPVDKMPLVEIICGEKTDDETLARAYNFVLQINKTPIVVNDSRGFYTSRVFFTYFNEGAGMLREGVAPAFIENAAWLAGFPVGPLAVADEVSLMLVAKIRNQTIKDLEAAGKQYRQAPGDDVFDWMLERDRAGRLSGAGFYEYHADGKKKLWSGLLEQFGGNSDMPLVDIKERLLFIMAVEAARCFEEQVLTSTRDANLGSIMGIGYPAWTGGTLQFINAYGVARFVEQAKALADKYGARFNPPAFLEELAAKGESL